ncbi:MAG: ATP-dependent zinc protease [Alphaproteobacteria bacterium]|nr:ATP-dependent zinc protease [Alphaproteobacteria bacterium]
MRKVLSILAVLWLTACQSQENKVLPSIVPLSAKDKQVVRVMPNNVIGEVEPIYFPPMKSPFLSRIDTGAASSSLDARDIKKFERDGNRWVSFTIVNRETGESHTFEKPINRKLRIKRVGDDEHRITVEMDVKMGGEKFVADFSVNTRDDFDYQTLIGRNILSGRAIVDVSVSNTLK